MGRQNILKERERARLHAKQHPLEVVYRGMMQRCGHWKSGNKRTHIQRRYEYRGVRVCEEWRHGFKKFEAWGLSHGWKKGLQIDRINNDGDYSPSNCRFVTPKENSNNRSNSGVIAYKGESTTKDGTYHRLVKQGMTVEQLFSTPKRTHTNEKLRSHKPA